MFAIHLSMNRSSRTEIASMNVVSPETCIFELAHEDATVALAQRLARALPRGVVYLQGDLGAGKTTLTRAWLHSKGLTGSVKSPTYTLVEPYQIAGQPVYHFDLYRLNDPFELELMGIRDYVAEVDALMLIEWPQKGEPVIPAADWLLEIRATDDAVRHVRLTALTPHGRAALQWLQSDVVEH